MKNLNTSLIKNSKIKIQKDNGFRILLIIKIQAHNKSE